MILEVKNLTVEYPGVKALDDVSFSLEEGEILGLVGESGSGKSTLAYSVLNLLSPAAQKSGQILFRERDILTLDEAELQVLRGNQIGLIMQEPAGAFNPVLSIGYQFQELLCQKLKIATDRQEREKVILDCFGKVRLPEPERILRSYPHQLSGGQLQRVAIAMSVALGPVILIADEPTSSLDVTIESQIVNLFEELKDSLGLTLIFITHNLDLVKALCDRAVVLYQGRVREINKSQQLMAAPQDSYTKSLLAAFKELEE